MLLGANCFSEEKQGCYELKPRAKFALLGQLCSDSSVNGDVNVVPLYLMRDAHFRLLL